MTGPSATTHTGLAAPDWHAHALRLHGLLVFGGLLRLSPLRELVALAQALSTRNARDAMQQYSALFGVLVNTAVTVGADALTHLTVEALAFDENALSRGESRTGAVRAAAISDLRTMQALLRAAPHLPQAVAELAALDQAPPWPVGGASSPVTDGGGVGHVHSMVAQFAQAPDWGALVDAVAAQYTAHGSGVFARYRAFRWAAGTLLPVEMPDVPPPASLVGYQQERALLRANTAQFVAGFRANNVLLYGDRGTGKSSSVKSLLWDRQGDWNRLRLVEVPKALLAEFPAVVAQLRERPQRFILFVDDLSFEEGETQYKEMKAVLEGGLEARPDNVVVYATSNRRHLVREQFTDRTAPGSGDVHAWDTVQEKLSFADRFGIAITFPTPDQAAYLSIVEGLAQQRGLAIEPAALRARAVEWAAWHNGRSGRAARQLVDFLEGELGLVELAGPPPA